MPHSRQVNICKLQRIRVFCGLKAQYIPAQSNALGKIASTASALKGQYKLHFSFLNTLISNFNFIMLPFQGDFVGFHATQDVALG